MTEWVATGVEPQRGEYRFRVKDREGDEFCLACEPVGIALKIIGSTGEDLQVGFDLSPGTTRSEAEDLVRAMNKAITHIVLFSLSIRLRPRRDRPHRAQERECYAEPDGFAPAKAERCADRERAEYVERGHRRTSYFDALAITAAMVES